MEFLLPVGKPAAPNPLPASSDSKSFPPTSVYSQDFFFKLFFSSWQSWLFWFYLLLSSIPEEKKSFLLTSGQKSWKQERRAKVRVVNDASLQELTSDAWKQGGWSSAWLCCSSFTHEVSADFEPSQDFLVELKSLSLHCNSHSAEKNLNFDTDILWPKVVLRILTQLDCLFFRSMVRWRSYPVFIKSRNRLIASYL